MSMDKTFDTSTAEAAISARWIESGAFRAGANAKRDDTFCIMIPPPNVTGSLHMGHAFNNTLQDILTRWHRMRGFDTLWQPGTDHAGIATQMVVERQLAESGNALRRDLGRDEFVKRVWQWKQQSGGTIINQLKRLGASCDWDREAFTMSGNFPDAVLKVFVDLYHKGLIYKGKRLVNWDPHFETAISDLEVENIEKPGHMWHFKYPLADGARYEYVEKDDNGTVILREERDYISIATTRPETMLGDGAVAVHPSDERYAQIVGKLCEIPVGPKEHRRLIPIITDEYPDPDFGSGAVKITGAHDFNDYGVAQRNGIPMYRLMDTKAAMRSDGAPYAEAAAQAQAIAGGMAFTAAEVDGLNLVPDDLRGLDRFDARKRVIAQITDEGLAVMIPNPDHDPEGAGPERIPLVESKPIMQPFGDRSKVVIEPMLTDQWFVDTAKIVQPAIDAVRDGRVQILPEQHKKVYFNWLENIEPWCISRQLWWGHQVPVWYGPAFPDDLELESRLPPEKRSPKVFCASHVEQAVENAQSFYGDAFTVVCDPAKPSGYTRSQIGGSDTHWINLERDPDVLDTWFSSGLWPIGTLGWPNTDDPAFRTYFPTDVLITGFDIIFFWVARMMMMQLEVVKEVPFHTVYVHALVRDEKGKKMSKSLGNVLDPLELIDEYGADAVRFTLTSMAAMGRDLKLSTARIAGYRNFGTKLWNAARFAEMNGCVPDPDFDPRSAAQTVNRWIVGETARAREAVDAALQAYRFNDAANGLYTHVWGVVCDWYVEFSKPLLQSSDAAVVAETRATMAWVIDQCLILLHPVMPFITEHLWTQIVADRKMLVHADWPEYTAADFADASADAELGWVIGLIEAVRSVRAELNVTPGTKIPVVLVDADETARGRCDRASDLIARLARIESVHFAEKAPTGAVTIPLEGATLCLPLAGIVDVAAERARLDKATIKLGKEIEGISRKLSNAGFLAKAPEEVVTEQRERLAEAETEARKIEAALRRVEALA